MRPHRASVRRGSLPFRPSVRAGPKLRCALEPQRPRHARRINHERIRLTNTVTGTRAANPRQGGPKDFFRAPRRRKLPPPDVANSPSPSSPPILRESTTTHHPAATVIATTAATTAHSNKPPYITLHYFGFCGPLPRPIRQPLALLVPPTNRPLTLVALSTSLASRQGTARYAASTAHHSTGPSRFCC